MWKENETLLSLWRLISIVNLFFWHAECCLTSDHYLCLLNLHLRNTVWKWESDTEGEFRNGTERKEPSLNCGTYGDVITLAVKHLGIGIRPKPDNAFAMLVCTHASEENRAKWIGSCSVEGKKNSHQQRVCCSLQIDTWKAVSSWFDFADCHWICVLPFINECLLILAAAVVEFTYMS